MQNIISKTFVSLFAFSLLTPSLMTSSQTNPTQFALTQAYPFCDAPFVNKEGLLETFCCAYERMEGEICEDSTTNSIPIAKPPTAEPKAVSGGLIVINTTYSSSVTSTESSSSQSSSDSLSSSSESNLISSSSSATFGTLAIRKEDSNPKGLTTRSGGF
jgi:hypothetical protein